MPPHSLHLSVFGCSVVPARKRDRLVSGHVRGERLFRRRTHRRWIGQSGEERLRGTLIPNERGIAAALRNERLLNRRPGQRRC